MEYVIAVYRSRNISIKAYNFLSNNGVTCALVSTPRSANVGCGLSVKFNKADYSTVKGVLSNAETFVGFFLVKNTLSGSAVVRI